MSTEGTVEKGERRNGEEVGLDDNMKLYIAVITPTQPITNTDAHHHGNVFMAFSKSDIKETAVVCKELVKKKTSLETQPTCFTI